VAISNIETASDTNLGYGKILATLMRRKFWVLGTLLSVLTLSIAVTLRQQSSYQSSMQLLVEPNYQNAPARGDQVTPTVEQKNEEGDYATQLALMRSQQFVYKAVELLRPQYPELSAEDISNGLTLTQVQEQKVQTKIFGVSYISNDPLKTLKVLEALKQVYQEYNLDQQKRRLTEGLTSINEQLETIRGSLSKSQSGLERFRRQQNLIDPEKQADTVSQMLGKIVQEQQDVSAQYQVAQAQFNTLQQQLSQSPQDALIAARLSGSARFQNLLNELQKTELQITNRRVTFTDQAPQVRSLLKRRQAQTNLLEQEVERVLGQVSALPSTTGESLLKAGQQSATDLTLVGKFAEAQAALASLQARAQSLARAEEVLRSELNRFPGLIAEYDRLKPEIDIQRSVLQQLLGERQKLSSELSRGGFSWQVVEPPKLGKKLGPEPRRNLLLGAVVGLFLGGVLAFVREMIDGVVHTPDDLKRQVAPPLLGILPELREIQPKALSRQFLRGWQPTPTSPLQMFQWSPIQESLVMVYKNIQLLTSKVTLRSLVITSALPGEGKSTLVLGLALSAARLHQRVLVIDADLRAPSLHDKLTLSNQKGLSTLLEDNDATVLPTRVSFLNMHIDVLTAGPASTDPLQLLSSQRMRELITTAELNYDLVLLDTPPVLGLVDTVLVSSLCSGIVLVGRLDQVTQTEFSQAIAALDQLNVVGIVANGSHRAPTTMYNRVNEQNGNVSTHPLKYVSQNKPYDLN
jgi:capsular exopolysaccharide synthesis family protein